MRLQSDLRMFFLAFDEDDPRTLLMRYGILTRRFVVKYLNRPSMWDGSPFIPLHVSTILLRKSACSWDLSGLGH